MSAPPPPRRDGGWFRRGRRRGDRVVERRGGRRTARARDGLAAGARQRRTIDGARARVAGGRTGKCARLWRARRWPTPGPTRRRTARAGPPPSLRASRPPPTEVCLSSATPDHIPSGAPSISPSSRSAAITRTGTHSTRLVRSADNVGTALFVSGHKRRQSTQTLTTHTWISRHFITSPAHILSPSDLVHTPRAHRTHPIRQPHLPRPPSPPSSLPPAHFPPPSLERENGCQIQSATRSVLPLP
jgi:hypothetical protein